MATEPTRSKEHPSTYFVEDRSNDAERRRVEIQGQMITDGMGGVLPEQPDPTRFRRVIDVGCGTGGWIIEVAKTYPSIQTLVGADVSRTMLSYAHENAEQQQVNDRVEFHVMDALRMIEFPQGYFDLVNQRLGFSYLRKWDWPNLLQEYQRVTRLGGVIRITEGDVFGETNSSALTQFFTLARSAFYNAGHMFREGRTGVTSELPAMLHQQGILNVQSRSVVLHYRHDTPMTKIFFEDMKLAFRTILPFFRKWTLIPDTYDAICQQALYDMQQPDFVADWEMLTAWGSNPLRHENPSEQH